ncbi:MAG: hypothetical protein R3C52_08145 [Hyphomonadaceae bacterium]
MDAAEVIDFLSPIAMAVVVLVLGLLFGPFILLIIARATRGKIGPIEWENQLKDAAKKSSEAAEKAENSANTLDELSLLMAQSRITELELVLQTPLFPGSTDQRRQLEEQIQALRRLIERQKRSAKK